MEEWQSLLMKRLCSHYNDTGTDEKRPVELYLLGGHVVKGELDFSDYCETSLDDEQEGQAIKSGRIFVEQDDGWLFHTHSSQVVGFRFTS
jgi:hypothetical protein